MASLASGAWPTAITDRLGVFGGQQAQVDVGTKPTAPPTAPHTAPHTKLSSSALRGGKSAVEQGASLGKGDDLAQFMEEMKSAAMPQ